MCSTHTRATGQSAAAAQARRAAEVVDARPLAAEVGDAQRGSAAADATSRHWRRVRLGAAARVRRVLLVHARGRERPPRRARTRRRRRSLSCGGPPERDHVERRCAVRGGAQSYAKSAAMGPPELEDARSALEDGEHAAPAAATRARPPAAELRTPPEVRRATERPRRAASLSPPKSPADRTR